MPLEELRHDLVDYPSVVVAPSPKSVTSTLRNSTSTSHSQPQPQQPQSFVRKRLRTKSLLSDHLSMTPSPPILSSPSLALAKKRKSNSNLCAPESPVPTPVPHDDGESNKSAPAPLSEQPPKLKKRRNWAPIAVVPMKQIKLPTDLEPDALIDIKLQYLSMCHMEQQIFHVSTLLSVIKCVLRGHADLKKIAALGRRLSKTRKRFLNVQRAVFDVQNERNPAPTKSIPDSNEGAGASARPPPPPQISNPSDTDASVRTLSTRQGLNGNAQVTDAVASQLTTNANITDDNSLSHLSFGALDKSPAAPSELLPQSSTPSTSGPPPSPLDVAAQRNGISATLPQSQFALDNTSPIDTREIAAAYSQHSSRVGIEQQWLSSAEGLDVRQDVDKLAPPVELESQFGAQAPAPSPAPVPEMKIEERYQGQFEQPAPKITTGNPFEQPQPTANLPLQFPQPNHQFSPVTPVGSHRSVMGTAQEAFQHQHNNTLNWESSYPSSVTNQMNNRSMLQAAGQSHFNPLVMQQQQQQQQQQQHLVPSANMPYNQGAPRLQNHVTNQPSALSNPIAPQVPAHHPGQVRNMEIPGSFHPVQYGSMNSSSFHGVASHAPVEDVYNSQRMLGRLTTTDAQPASQLEQQYAYGNEFISTAEQQRSNMQAPMFDTNRVPTHAQYMTNSFGFAGSSSGAADGGNQYMPHRDVGNGGGIIAEMHAAAASANAGGPSQQAPQFHNIANVEGSVNTIFASDTGASAAAASSTARPNERDSFGSNSNTMSYLGAWGQAS